MTYTAAQINTIYNNILFRSADSAAIAGYANSTQPDASIRQQIETSAEETNNVDPIVRLYQAELGRVPDTGGLASFVHQFENGASLLSIAQALVGSQEAATSPNSAGTAVTSAFINNLYMHDLGRSASAAETSAQMASGASAAQLVVNVAQSQEAQNYELSNTITYLDSLAVSQPNSGSLNNQMTAVGGQTANQGNTYTLTTAIDNFVGTTGNDTFNGNLGNVAGAPTFNAGDSLNGNGGSDVLNLTDLSGGSVLPNGTTVSNIQTVNFASVGAVGSGAGNPVDFSTFAGVTALNVTGSGAEAVKASSTAAVAMTDYAQATSNISEDGGTSVMITANGGTKGDAIKVGATVAPTGAVNITYNELSTFAGANATTGVISVTGGTSVLVNDNLNTTAAGPGAGATVTGGGITVTGTANTTFVTASQSSATVPATPATAAATTPGAPAVAAAPGVQATPASVVLTALATAASSAVVDGAVNIADGNGLNTINLVALTNYGANSTIAATNMNNLILNGTAGTLSLTRGGAANSAFTMNLNNVQSTVAGLAVNGGNNAVSDANNEITTLNAVMGATSSNLTAFVDTGLATINISGSSVLGLGGLANNTSLTSIAVSGAAGFSGDISGTKSAVALTTSSSGLINAVLNATTETFVGSTGQDIITIAADATKVITGGSGASDEIILNANATTFTANTLKNVTGFEILGVGAASQGTYNVPTITAGIKALDVQGATAAGVTFTGVTAGTSLSFDNSNGFTTTYTTSDKAGASDSLLMVVGTSVTTTGQTVAGVTLNDSVGVGIGTVNISTNDFGAQTNINVGNTITTLTDTALSALNVSGTGSFNIGTVADGGPIVAPNTSVTGASLLINATLTAASGSIVAPTLNIGTLNDANLTSLTFGGASGESITTLIDATSSLTITDNAPGAATITNFTDATLASLTLNGNVAFGPNGGAIPAAFGVTQGTNVTASSDNAHISVNVSGAGAGFVDNIVVGNGNDAIQDGATAGTVNITVGTGSNLITAGAATGNTTGVFNVMLGAHAGTSTTGFDLINVTNAGNNSVVVGAAPAVPQTIITNTAINDQIHFNADGGAPVGTVSQVTAATPNSQSAAITAVETQASANGTHGVAYIQYGGNTYIAEHAGAANAAFSTTADSLVEVTGLHKVAALANVNGSIAITV